MNESPAPLLESPSLADQVQHHLRAADVPQTFAEIKKAIGKLYPKGTKKDPKPPKPTDETIQQELDGAVNQGTVFKHPPLSGNKVRYDTSPPPTPKRVVSELVQTSLATDDDGPFTEAELAKKPKTLSKPEFEEALAEVLGEYVAKGELYEHPPQGKKKRYGKTAPPPPPSPEELVLPQVKAKLATGDGPFKAAEFSTKPKGMSASEFKETLANVLEDFKARGELYEHPPSGRTKCYGKNPPPSAEDVVLGLVLAKLETGDGPFTEAELAKRPRELSAPKFKEALAKVLSDLQQDGTLHEHPPKGRTKQYGKLPPPPPKWYETPAYSRAYTALVKAAKKVVDLGDVSSEKVIAALQESLGVSSSKTVEITTKVTPESEQTPQEKETESPSPTTASLRTVLREAYDHLCLFVEFRHKMVELPRLFHEVKARKPDVTLEEFHRELWDLSESRQIELHVINEVRLAKEPELAIYDDDRLYYYARWK